MPRPIRSSGLLDAGDRRIDLLAELSHRPVGDGEEEFLFAGEIAIERPLADVEGLGEELRVGFRVAVFGKQGGGSFENFFPPSLANVLLGGLDVFAVYRGVPHGKRLGYDVD